MEEFKTCELCEASFSIKTADFSGCMCPICILNSSNLYNINYYADQQTKFQNSESIDHDKKCDEEKSNEYYIKSPSFICEKCHIRHKMIPHKYDICMCKKCVAKTGINCLTLNECRKEFNWDIDKEMPVEMITYLQTYESQDQFHYSECECPFCECYRRVSYWSKQEMTIINETNNEVTIYDEISQKIYIIKRNNLTHSEYKQILYKYFEEITSGVTINSQSTNISNKIDMNYNLEVISNVNYGTIEKYSKQEYEFITESYNDYNDIVLPYIEALKYLETLPLLKPDLENKIYDDRDLEIYINKNSTNKTKISGVILFKQQLYSLRSLNSSHLEILSKSKDILADLFKQEFKSNKVIMYTEYLPEYFNLYIKFTNLIDEDVENTKNIFYLEDIIQNICLKDDYYQTFDMHYMINKNSALYNLLIKV